MLAVNFARLTTKFKTLFMYHTVKHSILVLCNYIICCCIATFDDSNDAFLSAAIFFLVA